MNDTPPSPTPSPAEERAEAAAIRRRWISLGEMLAVIGVVISGLALWLSWQQRSDDSAERARAETKANRASATLLLRATAERDGRRLVLSPAKADQSIQSQTIRFPKALGLDPVETTGDARIDVNWLDDALRKARRAKKRAETSAGDERLPIAIATRFVAGDAEHEDVAVYDLGYVAEGQFLGTAIRLKGLSAVGPATEAGAQARIDALWAGR